VCVALGATAPIACLDPTQVTLRLASDACLDELAVFIDEGQITSKKVGDAACVAGVSRSLGSIVVVPGAHPRFTVRVEGTRVGGSCAKSTDGGATSGCVRASRVVSFQPHSKLSLPIDLDVACLDRDCPTGQTCVKGECRAEVVDCTKDGTCETDAGTPPDSGVVDSGREAGADAGSCPNPLAFFAPKAEVAYWDFEDVFKSGIVERHKNVSVPLATGWSTITPSSSMACVSGLVCSTTPQNLNYPLQQTFGASFWALVDPSVMAPSLTVLQHNPANVSSNTLVSLIPNTNPQQQNTDVVQLYGCSGPCAQPLVGKLALKRGQWHFIEVGIGPSAVIYVDGMKDTTGQLLSFGGTGAYLGPAPGLTIDELRFYTYP